MHEFPQRPEDLSALSNDELTALRDAAVAAILAANEGDVTPAVAAQMREALSLKNDIEAALADRERSVESLASEVDDIVAQATAGCATCGDESAADGDDEDEDEGEEDDDKDGKASDNGSTFTPVLRRGGRAAAMSENGGREEQPPPSRRSPVSQMTAAIPVAGLSAGERFDDIVTLSEALLERWKDVRGARRGEKFTVAQVSAAFDEDRILVEGDKVGNMARLGGLPHEMPDQDLAAAVCAPREPIYELGCQSSTARPVANSLAAYRAPRGGVLVYPSPKLADVEGGRGIWTRDDDEDDEAIKECARIPCATPESYDIYGVWRCLTVTNMNAMTFPELVAAFLNRLGALQAGLAETTMLNGMKGTVNTIEATLPGGPYGASIALLESIVRTVAVYREEERYGDVQMHGWAPRHLRSMLVADQILQRRTSGTLADRVAASREVDAAFAALGVNMTWTMDLAEDWVGLDPFDDGQNVPSWPTSSHLLLAPEGNFRRLDGGTLNIGVTPGNIYRDNASNARNEFTMFWESFEGVVDFGCRNLHLTLEDICVGGQQVADVAGFCAPAEEGGGG